MMNNFRLLAVCNHPSDSRPAHQAFVGTFLQSMASLGVDITVLAPETLWNRIKKSSGYQLAPTHEQRNGISIYRPRYMSFSNIPFPFYGTTDNWSFNSHARAVLRAAKKLPASFNLCLAHFLYPHGYAASRIGALYNIPVAVSLGESSFKRYEKTFDRQKISRLLSRFVGIITNSDLIKEQCIERYGISDALIRVFPNGVNEKHFYPRDRKAARQHCKLPLDRPIIISVGQLIERKGPLRIMEAIKSRPDIGAVFLGYGPQRPEGPQVLYKGMVPSEEVPIWLSAVDVFVLPTLAEGCSNAILEALSCGLPVVSSNLPFNHEILDDEVSIMIDPLDVNAIGEAITYLVENPERREEISRAALQRSRSFRVIDRAKRILSFLHSLS